MGLDNGIILKTQHKLTEQDIPSWIKIEEADWYSENNKDGYYYDVCYWRKCWNIRGFIFELDNIESVDCGCFELDVCHIIALQKEEMAYLRNPQRWEDDYIDGRTIWDAESMIPHLARDVANLQWLKDYMIKHKVTVEFYDSY